jgi:hypothetical protein
VHQVVLYLAGVGELNALERQAVVLVTLAVDNNVRVGGVSSLEKAVEEPCDHQKPGDVLFYADEFNVSWLPALRPLWSPKGQQVVISTLGLPRKCCSVCAVKY